MPAATTHVEFAKDVLNIIDTPQKEKITNLQMFYLGSQGPDVLLFSRASLLPGSLVKMGSLMHNEKVPEVILFFEKYAGDDKDLVSYIQGYLCHYALDSYCHPLINAVAHYNHVHKGVHEGEYHVTSEADIDVWMLQQRGRDLKDYDVYTYLKVDSTSAKKLANMYHSMFIEVFDKIIPARKFEETIRTMSTFSKFLGPSKGLYKFAYAAESLVRAPHAFSGMMLYDKNDFQVLNLEHKAYPLTFDPTKAISASFPELYGKAVTYCKRIMESHNYDTFDANFEGKPKKIAES